MSARTPVELPLDESVLREVVEKSKDWGLMHGMGVRTADNMDPNILTIAPHTLLPSPIPRKDFDELTRLQPELNLIMHKVAHDHAFLKDALKTTVHCDEFTRKLWEVYETVREEGFAQDFSLGLFRSDYLPDSKRGLYQQVEFNTMASSLSALTDLVKQLQSYVLGELGLKELVKHMPENNALYLTCAGLVKAWEQYGKENAAVTFVVEDEIRNICDHRFMEYEAMRIQPKIKVIWAKMSDPSNFKLGTNKELLVKGYEAAVVYFRVGYDPTQYYNNGWETRLLIERSRAIKCPSIQYHLAGTKKVQQVLALPNMLERFIDDKDSAAAVRKLFTEIYSLDLTAEGDEAYNLALRKPQDYVLKPQREGGGNNIYREDIPEYLKSLGTERQAFILMGLISPQPTDNYLVSRSTGPVPPIASVVSEFGIYGVIIGSQSTVTHNYQAGHMLRTKSSTSNEGGVAMGSGFLDSPFLV